MGEVVLLGTPISLQLTQVLWRIECTDWTVSNWDRTEHLSKNEHHPAVSLILLIRVAMTDMVKWNAKCYKQ